MFVPLVGVVFLILIITIIITHLFGAPYVPSTQKVVNTAIQLSGFLKNKKVVDLGSGDGRVVGALIKEGAEAHGYEINLFLFLYSKLKYRKGIFHLKSFWKEDLGKYDVIYVFGISYIMLRLENKLRNELRKGAKVVSYSYGFPHWKQNKSKDGVYIYIV